MFSPYTTILLNQPFFNFIVPCYCASSTISETIVSIQSQSYNFWRCIIIDDSSCDDTVSVVDSLIKDDSRFEFIKLSVNNGVSDARNKGLSFVKDGFIVFLDADDFIHTDFLLHFASFFSRTNYQIAFCSYYRFLDSNRSVYVKKVPPSSVSFPSLLLNNHLPMLGTVFHYSLLGSTRFGNQRPEDYIFWLDLFKFNKSLTAYIVHSQPLAYYRITSFQRSSNKLVNIKRAFLVYNFHLKYNIFLSLILCVLYIFTSVYDYVISFSFTYSVRSLIKNLS